MATRKGQTQPENKIYASGFLRGVPEAYGHESFNPGFLIPRTFRSLRFRRGFKVCIPLLIPLNPIGLPLGLGSKEVG